MLKLSETTPTVNEAPDQPESVLDTPKHLEYWQQTGEHFPEIVDFAARNALRVEELRHVLFDSKKTPDNYIDRPSAAARLYLSYGSFNQMEGGNDDLFRIVHLLLGDENLEVPGDIPASLDKFVAARLENRPNQGNFLLAGCSIHELAMLQEDPGKRNSLLLTARKIYSTIVSNSTPWADRTKGEAYQYLSDVDFYLATNNPDMSARDYQQFYIHSQLKNIRHLQTRMASQNDGVGSGFALEQFFQIATRRTLWEAHTTDIYNVVTAFPRQDRPHDGFGRKVHQGKHKRQAFDALITSEDARLPVQLKASGDNPETIKAQYVDEIMVIVVPGEGLRQKISAELAAMEAAYEIEAIACKQGRAMQPKPAGGEIGQLCDTALSTVL